MKKVTTYRVLPTELWDEHRDWIEDYMRRELRKHAAPDPVYGITVEADPDRFEGYTRVRVRGYTGLGDYLANLSD